MREREASQKYAGFIWNALSSMAAAASSVLLLMVVRRAAGMEVGADFSVAVAVANVLVHIGTLNNAGFQISDVVEQFHFHTYRALRRITVLMMLAVAVINNIIQSYPATEGRVVFLYCIYRAVYAYADVYQGRYQQKGRMDLAGKLQFFKVLLPDSLLAVCVMANKNVAMAISAATLAQIVLLYVYNRRYFQGFADGGCWDAAGCWGLFLQSLPLFFSAFAAAYILNSSKYSIDRAIGYEAQVYYAIMLLPATTVHMLASFVYRPMLTGYSILWNEGRVREFICKVHKIFIWMFVVAIGMEAAAAPVLLPILGWLYDAAGLAGFKKEFGVILLAGMLNAMNTFLGFILTIMRMQFHMAWVYAATFAAALFLPDFLVGLYGIAGAAASFFLLMLLQTALTYLVFAIGMAKKRRRWPFYKIRENDKEI